MRYFDRDLVYGIYYSKTEHYDCLEMEKLSDNNVSNSLYVDYLEL